MSAVGLTTELGFGYTWRDGAEIDWTDVSEYVRINDGISTQRGRSTEFDTIGPGSLSLTFANNDRRFDPSHAAGPHYGQLLPGVPIRVRTGDGLVGYEQKVIGYEQTVIGTDGDHVSIPSDSAYISTPDHASLDLTDDIDIRMRIAPAQWASGALTTQLANKSGGWAYYLGLSVYGQLFLSAGGYGITGASTRPTLYGAVDGQPFWVRATFRRDNGDGSSEWGYYCSPDGTTWTHMGSFPYGLIVTPANTSGALEVGRLNFVGTVYAFELRNGIGGTIVASWDADNETALPFADDTGKTWSASGGATFVTGAPIYGDDLDAPIYEDDLSKPIYGDAGATVLFTGYVTEWPQGYVVGDPLATVSIEASDLLEIAARTRMPRSALEAVIEDLGAVHHWPLDENEGQTQARDVIGGADATWLRGVTDLAALVPFSSGSYPRTRGVGVGAPQWATARINGTRELTVAWWASLEMADDTVSALGPYVWLHDGVSPDDLMAGGRHLTVIWEPYAANWPVSFNSDMVRVALRSSSTSQLRLYNSVHVTSSSAMCFVAVTIHADLNWIEVYINGTPAAAGYMEGTDVPLTDFMETFTHLKMGMAANLPNNMGHVALWDRMLNTDEVATLWDASIAPWDGDSTGDRIERLLDAGGWTGPAVTSPGGVILGPAQMPDHLLDALQQVADAEQGRLFVDAQGRPTLTGRYDLTDSDPAVTFADSDEGDYSDVSIKAPASHLINRVEVDGAILADAASIDAYGERSHTIDVPLLPNPARRRDLATYVLARNAQPHPRVYDLTIPLHGLSEEDQLDLLALDIGSRVAFVRHPMGVGDPIELEQVIEGLSIEATDEAMTMSLYLSPHDTTTWFRVGVTELDDPDSPLGY